jgi:Skp family chaperone for outer membrane proteins
MSSLPWFRGLFLGVLVLGLGPLAPFLHKEASPRRPAIAVINVTYVFKNCKKWTESEESFKAVYKEYDQKIQFLKKRLEACKATPAGQDQAARDANEREALRLQREVQDVTDEAKRVMGRRQGDSVVEMYKELERVAERYAQEHDLDLVLQYNEAITEADANNPANIQRKVATGSCLPLYSRPGTVDISAQILALLNAPQQEGNSLNRAVLRPPDAAGRGRATWR